MVRSRSSGTAAQLTEVVARENKHRPDELHERVATALRSSNAALQVTP